MVLISLILLPMEGKKYYAKRGLKKPLTVYVTETTYNTLLQRAKANNWSLQTLLRLILEEWAKKEPIKGPTF